MNKNDKRFWLNVFLSLFLFMLVCTFMVVQALFFTESELLLVVVEGVVGIVLLVIWAVHFTRWCK